MAEYNQISQSPVRALTCSTRTVGVIFVTHGLLRPEALDALVGVDYIFHAGDIGA